MKLLLLTLSMATALTLFSETTAVATDHRHHPTLAVATKSSRKLTSTRAPSPRRRRSSTSRAGSHADASTRSRASTESKYYREGKELAATSSIPSSAHLRERLRRQRRRGLSSPLVPSVVFLADTKTQTQKQADAGTTQSKIESNDRRRPSDTSSLPQDSPSTSNNKPDEPHAFLNAHAKNKVEQQGQQLQQHTKRRLFKRAVVDSSARFTGKQPADLASTPLLLLPDSHSTWQAGTFQTVQWSKQYAKSLPKDTTVDIVLVEAETNKKMFSLKRFIPVLRGSAQVWVPVEVPEDVSVVLVLELYHGRSQEQVSTALSSSASALSSSSSSSSSSFPSENSDGSGPEAGPLRPSSSTPTIVRKSDINISPRRRRAISAETRLRASTDPSTQNRDLNSRQPPPLNNKNTNVELEAGGAADESSLRKLTPSGSHHDMNDNDYYLGSAEERQFEFLPDELRQEYPSTVKPLELDHSFGLRQRVYTMTPYTLEWRTPERVQELLDYSARIQKALGRYIQRRPLNPVPPPSLLPKALFLSKVMVELVKDQTMEVVAVLAKDVPAETMFQYLSVQDRVPSAFYRLRVQMVVVQVHLDPETIKSAILQQQRPPPLQLGSGRPLNTNAKDSESGAWLSSLLDVGKVKPMEGWEFPEGGEVIDRYEAVTRKFYVAPGAL
ncbi:hypothetical protein EMPS_10266 [Entomortierella parvispora]|uniref:Uncharacterized protein n=1 Tax=Entomortierella parvispora TaxID=205924 RepID=A0A9P3HJQ0_9FUNG|nr:hypothetical protein EMPS_10266 [Entomortierella parvispora]